MHRSRIGVVLIDQSTDQYEATARFWAGVTGSVRAGEASQAADDPFESLNALPGGVQFALQRTGSGTSARVHLDLETDDVAAEVARVRGLGAHVVQECGDWTILADPGGLVFCVVEVQTSAEDFDAHAVTWP